MKRLHMPRPLTVDMEDYFHASIYARAIAPRHWPHLESRLERNTMAMLDLLDTVRAKATFFVLGWVAEKRPDLVRAVAARGHEVAAKCHLAETASEASLVDLARKLEHSKCAVEQAVGIQVFGNRFSITEPRSELDLLEVLAMKGFTYDSSVQAAPGFWSAQFINFGRVVFYEVPYAAGALQDLSVMPDRIPTAPLRVHLWEVDPDRPRLNGATSHATRGRRPDLVSCERLLKDYALSSPFVPVSKFLGLGDQRPQLPIKASLNTANASASLTSFRPSSPKMPISVVIPCFNEESSLPYLKSVLRSFEQEAADRDYSTRFILVDDGSTDGTLETLHRVFDSQPSATIIQHANNRGVSASILTGISNSQTEIVCSMDSDCTYDPLELLKMIPQLRDGIDVVTASPYHPQGGVVNVPRWRLTLSRGSSFLYRLVLPQKLFTYTSCFRVYRRTAVMNLHLQERGYLGVVEMAASLALQGAQILEHPAILESRILGTSKMKVFRTIAGHLRLLSRLLRIRFAQRFIPASHIPKSAFTASVDFK